MPNESAKDSLLKALAAAIECQSMIDADSVDESLDHKVVFRLREESRDIIKGIRISIDILNREETGRHG